MLLSVLTLFAAFSALFSDDSIGLDSFAGATKQMILQAPAWVMLFFLFIWQSRDRRTSEAAYQSLMVTLINAVINSSGGHKIMDAIVKEARP